MATSREVTDFMVWVKGELADLKKWQDSRDDNQKWRTRLFVGGVVTALIGNLATFLVAAGGWVVLALITYPQVIKTAGVAIVSQFLR